MGYRISTLRNLPMHHNFYFILIGDYHIDDRINNLFREDFNYIADNITESAIIQSATNRNLEYEIYRSLESLIHKGNKLAELIISFESRKPGLLIINEHPSVLNDNSLIVYISFTRLAELYTNNNDLLQDLIALAEGRNIDIIDKVNNKKGFWTKIGESLILEPNFSGIGINLKKLLEKRDIL
jgi:hypothetical protein